MARRNKANFLRRRALASTPDTTANPVDLQINYEGAKHGSLTLRILVQLQGLNAPQSIILVVSPAIINTMILHQAPHSDIPADVVSRVPATTNIKEIRLLTLTLREAPRLICPRPRTTHTISPVNPNDPKFSFLAQLAKATKLNILWNYGKMSAAEHALLHGFVILFDSLTEPAVNLRHWVWAGVGILGGEVELPGYEQATEDVGVRAGDVGHDHGDREDGHGNAGDSGIAAGDDTENRGEIFTRHSHTNHAATPSTTATTALAAELQRSSFLAPLFAPFTWYLCVGGMVWMLWMVARRNEGGFPVN